MQPIIAEERGRSNPIALWIPKLAGELSTGDHRMVQVTFRGRVEVRLCNDALALCFHAVCLEYLPSAVGRRVPLPVLELFLTEKKAKARMVDVHTQGTRVPCNEQTLERLCSTTPCQFSQSLKGIVDIHSYKGLALVKLPNSPPITAEAVVFAYAVLNTPKVDAKPIESAMAVKEIRDLLNITRTAPGQAASNVASAPPSPFVQQRSSTASSGGVPPQQASSSSSMPSTDTADLAKLPRAQAEYTKLAVRAWQILGLSEDKPMSVEQYDQALQLLGVFIFAPHARRLFLAFDTADKGQIDMSQFEALLIANDLLGAQLDLTLINVFAIFSTMTGSVEATSTTRLHSWDGSEANSSRPASAATSENSGTMEDNTAVTTAPSLTNPFKWPWGKKAKRSARAKNQQDGLKQHARLQNYGTLDFSALVEALDTMGYQLPEGQLLAVFKTFVQEKEEKVVDYSEFKELYMRVCDVERELIQLGYEEEARRTESVAKTLLHRLIEENEKAYIQELAEAPTRVARLRHLIRQNRDTRRRQRAEYFEKRARQDAHRQAFQNQEKRLASRLQQEQRGRQREQNRQLRKKLMESQALNRQQQQTILKARLQESESKAAAEAKAKGYDRLDLSDQGLRHVPRSAYVGRDAQMQLAWLEVLDLSHNKLELLPADRFLYSMPMLRKLVLECNRLKSLPDEVENVPSLQILQIDNNRLTTFPDGMSRLSQLERLTVANNLMTSLVDLSNCPALEVLVAHSNQLQNIHHGIGALQRLQFLDLSNNMLHALPEELPNARSLIYLNVRGNRLSHLPNNLGQLTNLQYLDISVNSISFLPKGCTGLTALEICLMDRNNIAQLQGTILRSSKLMEFHMPTNQADALPADVMHCRSLQHICLRQNHLKTIAPEIGLLRDLQSFDVACNSISRLPEEFGSCTGLQQCDLSRNLISGALPETIGLLSSLVDLNLAHNRITLIPQNFGNLELLCSLDVSHNELAASGLPASLTALSSLTALDLSHNKIARFPTQLLHMPHLTTLELAGNFIMLLPEQISRLTTLNKLGLESNELQILPPSFAVLFDGVREITLESNTWSRLPPKWGNSHKTNRRSNGYSVADVVQFTRAIHAVYAQANAVWSRVGADCYSGRMSFDDFEVAVRSRCARWTKQSHDALLFYFTSAKRYGMPPVWSDDEATIARLDIAAADDSANRDAAVAATAAIVRKIAQRHQINFEDLQHQTTQLQLSSWDPPNQSLGHRRAMARQQLLQEQTLHCTDRQTARADRIQTRITTEYTEQLHHWSALTSYELEDNVDRTLPPLALQLGVGRTGKVSDSLRA